jgi:hypothetical protein
MCGMAWIPGFSFHDDVDVVVFPGAGWMVWRSMRWCQWIFLQRIDISRVRISTPNNDWEQI